MTEKDKKTKNILCYGDSNTYGAIPITDKRYLKNERWPGILQELLGESYEVIEEGLNGRTTIFDDPEDEYRNGKKLIIPCMKTNYPFDLLIIMLGTNDIKQRFNTKPEDIARGAGILAKMAIDWTKERSGTNTPSKILLVSPIHINESIKSSPYGEEFGYLEGYEKSYKLSSEFNKVASDLGVEFMDAALKAEPSEEDGIHMSKEAHLNLAKAFAKKISEIYMREDGYGRF